MASILERLKTRFDPRIVQPDELAREAHDEIERLLAALKQFAELDPVEEYSGHRIVEMATDAINQQKTESR